MESTVSFKKSLSCHAIKYWHADCLRSNFFGFYIKKIYDVLTQWKRFIAVLGISQITAVVVPNKYQNQVPAPFNTQCVATAEEIRGNPFKKQKTSHKNEYFEPVSLEVAFSLFQIQILNINWKCFKICALSLTCV